MLLFVMAYHNEKEHETYQSILDHWDKLVEMKSPFKFLFVNSTGKKLNTTHEHTFLDHTDSPDTAKWKRVSAEWYKVARYISDNIECDYWFWWEHDVLPVKKDCFEFILSHRSENCQIMGYRVRDNLYGMRNRINGVAFYCRDYWKYIQEHFSLEGPFDTRRPFEPYINGGIFVELNKWYSLILHEGLLMLTPDIRLVHGIKDNSLRDQIIKGICNYPEVTRFYRSARVWLRIAYVNSGLKRFLKRE